MYAIVLAGGKGTRLWPLSRENYPKQFVEFINGESLFQLTIKRLLRCFQSSNIIIVTSSDYKFHIANQIESIKNLDKRTRRILQKNMVLEPCPKSTAPAVLLAMQSLGNKCADGDVFFVFPSDHIIQPQVRFRQCLNKAKKLAECNNIVIFGVKPKKVEAGYGYIVVGDPVAGGFKVRSFVEKPSPAKIRSLLKKKAYWNAGIFCFRKQVFFEELKEHAPGIFKYSAQDFDKLRDNFSKIPRDSIDYAIMQKTKRAVLVEFSLTWSDLGSWESVLEYFSKGDRNFSIGKAQFLEAKDCFAFSKDKLISLLGVNDLLVVEDSDSILVMKKGFSDKVKTLTNHLKAKKIPQVKDSLTVYRPWGYYTILKEKANYKVKEIGIYPKKYVSLQRHKYRSEHWNVVEGKAEVTLQGQRNIIRKNEGLFVPKGLKHRIYNPTDNIVIIIEVQIGSYLGEDDIKRYSSY